MQTVADYFKRLSHGQLSNLSMGNDSPGTIRVEDRPRVIQNMNEALLRLYTRFTLKEGEVILQLFNHITQYHLDKRFALHNKQRAAQHIPYIRDLPNEPYENQALSILTVFDCFTELALNNSENPASLYTPFPTTLQVPYPAAGTMLGVQYRARDDELRGTLEQEVIVPAQLEGAFLSFVGYLTYTQLNTQEAQGIAAGHMARYEAVCGEIEQSGSVATRGPTTLTKFDIRGWI